MVAMRSPTGETKDIRPAGVAALKRLGWTEETTKETQPTKKAEPAKKAPAKRTRRKRPEPPGGDVA